MTNKLGSFFEVLRVGWDGAGVSTVTVKTSDLREIQFGKYQAAIWSKSFTEEMPLVGFYGKNEGFKDLISSIGSISFDSIKCRT